MNHKFFKLSYGFALTLVAAVLLNTKNTSALYQSSLSAYVDNVKTQVDGDLLLDNPSVKREMNLNIGVTAKNKSGYKVVVNSKTDNTALNNSDPAKPDKIESITGVQSLNNFTANTWGYKLSTATDYSPIPSLSHPATVANNAEKEVTNQKTILNLGINIGDDLRPGDYVNQLVVSVVANTYQKEAIMDKGEVFNKAITYLGKRSSSNFFGHGQEMIEYFRRSTTAPTAGDKAIEVQDNLNSDYAIKVWYKEADKTVYYYAETEKIFLAPDSSNMFKDFTHVQDLDLAKFDTSNVVNMASMFDGAEKVQNLNLANFDTARVTNMRNMFSGMTELASLDLSNFNTKQVTDASNLLSNLQAATEIKLGNNFTLENATTLAGMFANTCKVVNLDLSMLNTTNVRNFSNLFSLTNSGGTTSACPTGDALTTIYASTGFVVDTSAQTENLFNGRTNLRGGNGAHETDPATADKTWLRIDAAGTPGYFTAKP